MNKYYRGLLVLFGILACTSPKAEEQAEKQADPAGEQEKIARGLLLPTAGRLILAPCRERTYVNVEDMTADGQLTSALKALGLAQGKSLYVELLGRPDGGNLQATGINFARVGTGCQPTGGPEERWRATGATWSFAAGGELLRLSRDERPELNAKLLEVKADASQGEALLSDVPGLEVRFERGACQTPGTAVLFGWRAEIRVDGQVLSGCAWRR